MPTARTDPPPAPHGSIRPAPRRREAGIWFSALLLLGFAHNSMAAGGAGAATADVSAAKTPAYSVAAGFSYSFPNAEAEASGARGESFALFRHGLFRPGYARIPLDVGLAWRRDRLAYDGWYGQDVFTQVELPLLFHGNPFADGGIWDRLEGVASASLGYTWAMTVTGGDGPDLDGSASLRTRWNLEYGLGLQIRLAWGTALRAVYGFRQLAPYAGSPADWNALRCEASLPLLWKRAPRR